ncbi:MAG: hypothetical protein KF850_09260 [Labilithrix sp.]|nr:hypothetical protein [Labilithrix sp.]
MSPRSPDALRSALVLTAALVLAVRTVGCAAGTDDPSESDAQPGDGGGPAVADGGTHADASLDGGDATTDERCSEDGWCRVDMPDDKAALYGIWGSGPDDVWTVGSNGAVFHWDGSTWSAERVETDAGQPRPLFGIWGTGPDDVWAFSATDLLHSRGWTKSGADFSSFEVIKRPGATSYLPIGLRAVWGSSSTDVWVLQATTGAPGALAFDKCSRSEGWVPEGPKLAVAFGERSASIGFNLWAIWGSSPRDIWMIGERGRIFHSDGFWGGMVQWSQVNSNTYADLRGVWGTAADDVWVVGDRGTIRHFTPDPAGQLRWAASDADTTHALHAVWASSATDVWAVGDEGTILHGDGSSWSRSRAPSLPPSTPLWGVWGSGPDDVWVVGQRVLLHRRGPTGGSR